ncbi:RelA/SpoT family protein [Taylorella asinigenitalis]|uniref:RelA/SpoT family protein n=1 Tax=Taylorella asinigenitalis TaxID=84590 RepID=UPI0004238137|nr:bifunctional (p)ppGpp synthetase/guanosine-3',5'-bis(diphosphate) 3'-pyrophosphohydrolase [Taylorella asinigenitalis]
MKHPIIGGDDLFNEAWQKTVFEDFTNNECDFLNEVFNFALPYLQDRKLRSQEGSLHHAKGMIDILSLLQLDVHTLASSVLVVAAPDSDHISEQAKFKTKIMDKFGEEIFDLVEGAQTLKRIGIVAHQASLPTAQQELYQQELLRKMLLAMATDLRIVLIRLASRLQTLRWFVDSKLVCPPEFLQQNRTLYAPLANRLGIWQIKWELEDLSFRFENPETYREIANRLEATRAEREQLIRDFISKIKNSLDAQGIQSDVSGRAKHIFSIYNKMKNKSLKFEDLYDLLAIRVIVQNERDCYTTLSYVHSNYHPVMEQFDDYIARPKPNGYRSLHTVVRDDNGAVFEVQIRTQKMHEFAEYGMAAHWRYKEAGAKGGTVSASSLYDRQISWMRQLLAWRKEVGIEEASATASAASSVPTAPNKEDKADGIDQKRIYVMTPQSKLLELPEGSTPVDFAYLLHTDLGHRCRGARVDGQLVSLNTPLQTGQTVEIITAKSGGPSRDWLNPELGYLKSPRARAKVRLWFNAIALQEKINNGQALVEKELQRLGKTAVNLETLAQSLGFSRPDDLFLAIGKDEFSVKALANAFQENVETKDSVEDEVESVTKRSRSNSTTVTGKSGVLVVGVDSLMTQLARCCHPAPPDDIGGYVTRGRGVTIHRLSCSAFDELRAKHPERVIDVSWGDTQNSVYPVDIQVHAMDRTGLIRDISDVLAKQKVNVIAVNSRNRESYAYITLTLEIMTGDQLNKALANLTNNVPGVLSAKRI